MSWLVQLLEFVLCSENTKYEKLNAILGKLYGKAVPLQVWTGPEGSRRLRLTDFKTIGT